jgi:hypothetical protein
MASTAHRQGAPVPTATVPLVVDVVDVVDVADVDVVGTPVLVGSAVTNARGTVGSDGVAGWIGRLARA